MAQSKKSNPITSADYRKTIFSPRWFIENMLYIVDKKNKLVQFKLNQEQKQMLDHIEFCLDNDLPIRIIVLKARQIGATTFFSALGFWFSAMNRNMTYGIVAHRLDSAGSIFQKCKIYYNNLPPEMRPSVTQLSSDGITFDKKDGTGINSKIQFSTVNEGVFRGQTLSYLHLSECAFWEGNVQAVENSLAPTVSVSPRTIIVRESTANGYNFFKDDWDRAVQGKSEYTPFFFGWQDHEEYWMRKPNGFVLTEDEERLKAKFKLVDEQLVWRRYQIDNNYGGNPMWFSQENPMTPQEAFVASGAGVFDSKTIHEGYEACKEPIKKIALKSHPTFEKLLVWKDPEIRTDKIYHQKAQWDMDKQEYVFVDTDLLLEEITYMKNYTIGVDTSGMGADKNQVVVVDNETKEMVARYEIKNLSERYLAKIAVEIAIMYNEAIIAPEVNYSHAICDFIMNDENYKNVYITESLTRKDRVVTGGIEYGFKTTSLTKPHIISSLRSLLTENASLIPDREFWYEAEYYLIHDTARNIMGASQGHHDDIIMATAIAYHVSESFQNKKKRIVKKSEMNVQHFLVDLVNKNDNRQSTKLRKGVYRNNA